MIPVSELNNMSESQLISIYRSLNYWNWSPLLGEAPKGWDKMPNYKKPNMGECQTKADIIRPYMKLIESKVPDRRIYPGPSTAKDPMIFSAFQEVVRQLCMPDEGGGKSGTEVFRPD